MITISIHSDIVPVDLLSQLEQPVVYSTMHPIKSPYFKTAKEVDAWYNNLPHHSKMEFFNTGMYCIYQHDVELAPQTYSHGYTSKYGEILSTDECYIYDFKERRWL